MKKITILFSIILASFTVYAQNNYTYNFSTFNENYTNITNSTSLNNGMFWDDPEYTIPIGFNFEIAGNIISTIYISLSDVLISSELDFNNDIALMSLLSPGTDLLDRGSQNNSLSNISYVTEGNTGNRIFKLEWNNAGFFDGLSSEYINLQLWLYENDHKVEFRYGDSNIVDPTFIFEGENGPLVSFWPSYNDSIDGLNSAAYLLSGNSSNPTVIEVLPGDEDLVEPENLTDVPAAGTVYRFTPNSNMSLDKNNFKSFEIYPNPSEDFIAINTEVKFLDYTIYNHLGKRVANGELKDKIEIANLASGIYFLELSNGSSKEIEKFIKK